jgi:hypothetical protein
LQFDAPSKVYTTLEYFHKFFDESLFDHIAEQTNLYSVLTHGSSVDTSPSEIKALIGIEILMGVINMPAFEDYWALPNRYSQIADVMPVKRFKKLRRLIHFQDNNSDEKGDRHHKIRSVLERIRQNCLRIEQENLCSVDEMMIGYKGSKAGNICQRSRKNGASKCSFGRMFQE